MKELKHQKIWLIIGLIYTFAIFYLCLRQPGAPIKQSIPHLDKLLHFSAYFCLMSYFVQIVKKDSYILIFIVFLTMGILIEFLQLMTGYRSFEVLDMLANTAGLITGWSIFGNYFPSIILSLEKCLYFKNS